MNSPIQITHVGSLPRPEALLTANNRVAAGEMEMGELDSILTTAVEDVVRKQVELGIDIVNDGEYGHATSGAVDYGAWWNYSFYRIGGLTMTDVDRWANPERVRSTPGNIRLTSFPDRRDRARFNEAYTDPSSGIFTGRAKVANPKITDKITYTGQDLVQRDVRLLRSAMEKTGAKQGFIAAISPGSAARLPNEYYADEKALLSDMADALAVEYRAITDAGLIVQIDAPDLAEAWDQINPEPSVEDFQAWLQLRIDAINQALVGIDPELVRLHICWGSWHGPHTTDIDFAHIVDQCLQVKAKSFSFEAASPRHAHEWRIWEERELGQRKLVPGLVSHSTNIVEHPQLVAERLERFAAVVGAENLIASTDCGLGGRIHRQIAWAKLEALAEGTQIANQRLGS
ncbi:cobalamin-independent methionine synthase II family protein [Arcanobacterium hippocoleae]|uniref:5-methyltetrahydropteroyltriglutamate--homocysteine methyltransferase n=1 Tax=Arcanobacterium hippocoleae TaxID=149017 RepID=A0ABU1T2T1_9ACTO|nr:cobalamin-independent methionine synthase II family protein [Arcanobacterium hippocoleae]MDR6939181.1 5-methyltetrahydropteroyltriglutamate--homocysteine methyltransferase [Arcanobacterium hippocoleae]